MERNGRALGCLDEAAVKRSEPDHDFVQVSPNSWKRIEFPAVEPEPELAPLLDWKVEAVRAGRIVGIAGFLVTGVFGTLKILEQIRGAGLSCHFGP